MLGEEHTKHTLAPPVTQRGEQKRGEQRSGEDGGDVRSR